MAEEKTLGLHFKLVFLTVASLTTLIFIVHVSLAIIYEKPSGELKTLIESCSTGWKMGFGTILGLIGGKKVS